VSGTLVALQGSPGDMLAVGSVVAVFETETPAPSVPDADPVPDVAQDISNVLPIASPPPAVATAASPPRVLTTLWNVSWES